MPELTIHRTDDTPPPMVCMYCGREATATTEWEEANRKSDPPSEGGGTDLSPAPTGDDTLSTVVAIIMLPVVLWELVKSVALAIGAVVNWATQPPSPPSPPEEPAVVHTTRVVVTTCDRHRQFRAKYIWAGAASALLLIVLWAGTVTSTVRAMGTENVGLPVVLLITAVFATVLLPLGLSAWYAFTGPVAVDRVTEDTVVLGRVRQEYFDATGRAKTSGSEQGS